MLARLLILDLTFCAREVQLNVILSFSPFLLFQLGRNLIKGEMGELEDPLPNRAHPGAS